MFTIFISCISSLSSAFTTFFMNASGWLAGWLASSGLAGLAS